MRLVDDGCGVRLVAPASAGDHTAAIQRWSELRLQQFAEQDICGYVFKRSSPTCGLYRVKVYRNTGVLHRNGIGLFASALVSRFPDLPVEEEGRLKDPRLRENFVARVFSYQRWMELNKEGLSRAGVMQFHARHKFLLMAHSQTGTRKLGRLAARGEEYFNLFCEVMRRTPNRENHTNVLQHLAGYFRDLNKGDRAELCDVIDRYRLALIPLIVPVTLIRHYVRKYAVDYLQEQAYLNPHPHELMLLNGV
jgi:uncharacterized protein YbgA (DUF1722 family)